MTAYRLMIQEVTGAEVTAKLSAFEEPRQRRFYTSGKERLELHLFGTESEAEKPLLPSTLSDCFETGRANFGIYFDILG